MSQLQDEVNKIIDSSVKQFLIEINSIAENGLFRKNRKIPIGFQQLETANNTYYEYAFFERVLEWKIRDTLINQSLMCLFDLFDINSLWPNKKCEVLFNNEAIEDIYPFEFIIEKDNKRIGYRYTSVLEDDIDELLNNYNLSEIYQINWNIERKDRRIENINFQIISFEDFFKHWFIEVDFETVFNKLKLAVKNANDDIGFDTIPRLTLRYLSNFKIEVDKDLYNRNYRDDRFLMVNDEHEDFNLENIYFDEKDYKVCDERFIDRGLYKSLLGSESFAKCFITAEYQYQIFKNQNNFDFTSVACGYLKAIEQLIYRLIQINLEFPSNETLWIMKNSSKIPDHMYKDGVTVRKPKKMAQQVIFKEDFKDYFNIILTPMINFLKDNEHGWNLSDDARKKIYKLLKNYAQDCRNDHFHKDNIGEFSVVTKIRNNTILLFYLLIGGYKMSDNLNTDKKSLGIDDNTFDRLYKNIQELPRGIKKFILRFDNTQTIKAYKHYYQEKTIYNSIGSVSESKIRFVKVDDFSSEKYENAMEGRYSENEFYITNENMPVYVAYLNGKNEEIQIF